MGPVFCHMLKITGYTPMTVIVAVLSLLTGLTALYIAKSTDDLPDFSALKSKSSSGIKVKPRDESTTAKWLPPAMNVQDCIRTRSFWLLWIIWAIQGAAGVSMITHSTSYGLSKGMALESAVLILTAFNATNGAGRLISGYLSDNIGRNLTMSITFFAAGLAYFFVPHSSSLLTCAALAAVIGFSFGTLFSVSAPLVSDCFGLQHFGAIFDMVFTAYGFFAGLLGPSLSGYILDVTGNNFSIVFMYLGIFCLISGLGIRRVVPPRPSDSYS
jgi:OFA family oxalate/formate antiporter-like MFS transporter